MRAIVRDLEATDINFILNSFLRSLRGYPSLKDTPNELYYPHQKKVIEHFIRNRLILVLCNSELPDQIFGYVIGDPNKETNFVYVKYPYRKLGFGKRLLETLHSDMYKKTLVASYTCRSWPEVSAKFRHIHNPFMETACV